MMGNRGRVGFRTASRRIRPLAVLLPLLSVVLLVAGCSGVPSNSAAVDVTRVAEEQGPIAPQAPQPGQQPDQIVRGWIAATARTDLDVAAGSAFAAAREYLTPAAQATWQPSALPVVELTDGYRTESSTDDAATVTIGGISVGNLDVDRAYRPTSENYESTVHLEQVDGQWRIADPPAELLVTAGEFDTAFRERTLYFLDQTGSVVVPDPRHVVVGQSTANRASRLMAMVLAGPSSQLRGAVRTPFTAQSALRSNPIVDEDGVLQIDLTGVDVSTPDLRRQLTAVLVWTLSPTDPRIAVSVDGSPVDPSQPVATINSVSSFDPDRVAGTGQVNTDPYFVDPDGKILALDTLTSLPGPLGTGTPFVRSAAQSSATGAVAAVADDPSGGQVLFTATQTGADTASPVLKADSLTAPSFSREGDQAWVVQNGGSAKPEIYRVSATGGASRERVGSTALVGRGDVTSLALSPDGVHVALVAGDRLYMGVIAPADDDGSGVPAGATGTAGTDAGGTTWQVNNLAAIQPELVKVGAVQFSSSRELIVAGATTATSYRTLSAVSIDGSLRRSISDQGIFGDVESIAVAPGQPLLVAFGGRVWQLQGAQTDGQWTSPLGDRPFLNGSSPFYPR